MKIYAHGKVKLLTGATVGGRETVHLMSFILSTLICLNVFLLNSVSYFHTQSDIITMTLKLRAISIDSHAHRSVGLLSGLLRLQLCMLSVMGLLHLPHLRLQLRAREFLGFFLFVCF